MRKLIVALMVGSLVLAGIGLATAADLPQALKGVDLSVAKKVTDKEAKEVKGEGQGPGICTNVCVPPACSPNLYLGPGPHRK